MPKLSIIIVNYKTPALLKNCIESLFNTIHTTPYEVIVVDSESDGEAPHMLKEEFPDVRCIAFRENSGYAKAVNAGIAQAEGDYFLVLNTDIIATEHAIDVLVAYMEGEGKQERVGMVGPKLYGFENTYQQSAFHFPSPLTIILRRTPLGKLKLFQRHLDAFLLKDKNLEKVLLPLRVDWLMGAALLVSKEAVARIGPMDESFFMYFEDVDWARRFWEDGYTVMYHPLVRMYHYHGKISHRHGMFDIVFNTMTRVHVKSAVHYFLKHGIRTPHHD
ncbi:MAG: glycosyltransferase family 2 protein [Candidatus Azambacteria bacterium]|nr:glycosyltransferase family 2 protein [Candidatus Azambacteria bacterium]